MVQAQQPEAREGTPGEYRPFGSPAILRGTLQKETARVTQVHVSLLGGFRIGLKRGTGHGSAASFLAHVEAPLSKWCVWRWERLTASALICRVRQWYTEYFSYLKFSFHNHDQDSHPRRRQLGWVVHAVRGDATNAKVGDAKAHAT